MNIMSREFTTSEKILIAVLSILLVGLLYYRFVYVTTEEMTSTLKSRADIAQADLDLANAKIAKLENMEKEMDEMDISEDTSRMESYNNSKRETAFLNQVLRGVSDYSISFTEITRDGDQIRRTFTLQFETKSYNDAVGVVSDLTHGEYRCLVDDINYSLNDNNVIYINLTATFFETMVGGTPDSALPKDEAEEDELTKEGISIEDFE
ncbi:MAG: hypothetical protein IKF07_05835 [Eubacterium sp.]|nr:hypothetical protein [Eubacterium sp.]